MTSSRAEERVGATRSYDTPTALYLTAVQVPDGDVVGEFAAPGGDEWGALLAKDSPLTACVSAADRPAQGLG